MNFFSDTWVREVQERVKAKEQKNAPTYDAKEVDDYIIELTARIKTIRQDLRRAIG